MARRGQGCYSPVVNRARGGCAMPFKPNYNLQRAERNRLKQEKKDAKERERAEAVARRRAEQDAAPSETPDEDRAAS